MTLVSIAPTPLVERSVDDDQVDHWVCCEAVDGDSTVTLCGLLVDEYDGDADELYGHDCEDCLQRAAEFHCPYTGSCGHG